jgi:hypothetical protein
MVEAGKQFRRANITCTYRNSEQRSNAKLPNLSDSARTMIK